MNREGLHPGLQAPLRLCENIRLDVLELLRHITPDEWEQRENSSTWTVAEFFDHLILAEIGTSKMARRLIRGDYAGLVRPSDARLYDSSLDKYPYGRYPAPLTLVPSLLSLDEASGRFDEVHRRFVLELGRFKGEDPDALASEDPDTGLWFTLAGWVRLQGLHEAHHLQQIRLILSRR